MRAGAAFTAALTLELRLLRRGAVEAVLVVVAAVSLLVLVSLFGLTAADAPMALIVEDRGPYARPFVESLVGVPHAFRLLRRTPQEAEAELSQGHVAGAITIPAHFSSEILAGRTVAVEVEVDNVNVDLVADLQRALPAAILGFGKRAGLPGLRVGLDEHDVWPRDTSFLPYITVSGLALVAFLVSGVLGALGMCREWETRTIKLLWLSPCPSWALLAGKLAAASLVSAMAMAITTLLVVFGYHAFPLHPLAAVAGLLVAVVTFAAAGAWLGARVRRSLVVVPLLFGLTMPLYIESGALEPTRFDGEAIWLLAHLTPLYYAVGFLEWAFFGLRITPEPPLVDLAVLAALGAAAFLAAARRMRRATARGAP